MTYTDPIDGKFKMTYSPEVLCATYANIKPITEAFVGLAKWNSSFSPQQVVNIYLKGLSHER